MLGVRIPAATDPSHKTGSDISTAKCSSNCVTGDDHYKWMPGVTIGVAPKDPHCSMAMGA